MARSTFTYIGGSVVFITLKGQGQKLGLALDEITRPGVDGHAFRQNAKRGEPFEMIGKIDCTDFDAAQATYANLLASQGQIVSVTDDYGETFANLVVLKVIKTDMKPLLTSVGGKVNNSKALLVVTIRFQPSA